MLNTRPGSPQRIALIVVVLVAMVLLTPLWIRLPSWVFAAAVVLGAIPVVMSGSLRRERPLVVVLIVVAVAIVLLQGVSRFV
jgi:hypothetical protein